MATVKLIPDFVLIRAGLEMRSLSGIILVSGVPAARKVVVYKNGSVDSYASTISEYTAGAWSLEVNANDNDRFRVVIVGQGGEYSKIFRDVVAG